MANIKINEISDNYSYATGTSSFASVALPITACWGPAYEEPATLGIDRETELESVAFTHFPSSQVGLEAFISTYRGPAANYRSAKDFSYQLAMTLITSGYDIDVCRVCPGAHAQATLQTTDGAGSITFRAKYAGTFGNNLKVVLKKIAKASVTYWNAIVYIVDSSNTATAVENIVFVFDLDKSTDSILHVSEITSNFIDFVASGIATDSISFGSDNSVVVLEGGSDRAADSSAADMIADAQALAEERFGLVPSADATQYLAAFADVAAQTVDVATASKLRYNEWVYTAAMYVLDILTDKLAYNPNRIIVPGWDDQNISEITGEEAPTKLVSISPLHAKLMDVAYNSRCATAFIDIPKCLPRSAVYNESASDPGYAQILSSYVGTSADDALFASHSALFAPWGQYRYTGTAKQNIAPPSFLALIIQRAMILNQSLQYEWALPTTRKHNINVGKFDYNVPKKLLDEWQTTEGTSLNVLADIPDLGVSVWGNSTLFSVPVATYNALQNLSSRFLVNAIENVAYRCGVAITFQYNNSEAYSKFYAGVSPILDTMKNVGAIEAYKIKMDADINGIDSVNANSVIGKIYVNLYGVINSLTIDLVALPQGTDLGQY